MSDKLTLINLSPNSVNLPTSQNLGIKRRKFYLLKSLNSEDEYSNPLVLTGINLVKGRNQSFKNRFNSMSIDTQTEEGTESEKRALAREMKQCRVNILNTDNRAKDDDKKDNNPENKLKEELITMKSLGNVEKSIPAFLLNNQNVSSYRKIHTNRTKNSQREVEVYKRNYNEVAPKKYQGFPFPGVNYVLNFYFQKNKEEEIQARKDYQKLNKKINREFEAINEDIEVNYNNY